MDDDDDVGLDVFGDEADQGGSARGRIEDDGGEVLESLSDEGGAGESADDAGSGGEAPAAADRVRQAQEAATVASQWDTEAATRQAAVDAAKQQLEKAEKDFEDGANNSKERVEALDKLTEARLALREAEGNRARAHAYAKQQAAPSNQAMEAWVQRNPRFSTDARFADEAVAAARAIANERGLRDDHPEFYRELDRRLKRTPAMRPKNNGVAAPSRAGAVREGGALEGVPDGALSVLKRFGGRMGLLRPGMSKDEQRRVAQEFGRHYRAMEGERGRAN